MNVPIDSTYKMLPLRVLRIDPKIQRDIDHAWVKKIAANWSDDLANPIEVTKATSGHHGYNVHNGQHTTLAARIVGKEFILCRIVSLKTKEAMVDRVLAVNTSQKAFTKMDQFKVVSSNKADSDEAAVRRIIEENGMEVGKGSGAKIIRSTQSLMDAYYRTGDDFNYVAAVIGEFAEEGIKVGAPDLFAISTLVHEHGQHAACVLVENVRSYPKFKQRATKKCIGVSLASSPKHLVRVLSDELDLPIMSSPWE